MLNEAGWFAVAFIVFIYFAYRPVRSSILGMLDKKIAAIRADIEESKALPQKAEELLQAIKNHLAEVDEQIADDLKNAEREIADLISEKAKELENFVEQRKDDSKKHITYLTEQAIMQIHHERIDGAVELVNRYLDQNRASLPSDLQMAKLLLPKK